MSEFAQAWPTKRFFLEMFVRDISLEDAILDLVDNSIDSLARTKNIPLSPGGHPNSPSDGHFKIPHLSA